MKAPACMGGWCAVRDSCRHYHASDRREPADRLCLTGSHEAWRPVVLVARHVADAQARERGEAKEAAA